MFVGVLVHELGHAAAALLFKTRSVIRLYAFGGLTFPEKRLGRGQSVLMALAGPGAGFLLGALVFAASGAIANASPLARFAVVQLMWVNVGWGVINLLPVLPLDGGHVLLGLLGPRRQRAAVFIGGLAASLVALGAGARGSIWIAVLFGMLALRNFQALSSAPRRPEEAGMTVDDALGKGWQALSAGDEREAGKLGSLVLEAATNPVHRNRARNLLAWVALAQANRREALRHLERTEPPEAARALTWAMVLEAIGEEERALPYSLQALEQEPSETSASLAVRLHVHLRRYDEARRIAEGFGWPRPGGREAALGEIGFGQGEFGQAALQYSAGFELSKHPGEAYNAACSYARAGDTGQAIAWLRRALDAGLDDLDQLRTDPNLASVRADPEFTRLLEAAS